jgi:hypothetical protein
MLASAGCNAGLLRTPRHDARVVVVIPSRLPLASEESGRAVRMPRVLCEALNRTSGLNGSELPPTVS